MIHLFYKLYLIAMISPLESIEHNDSPKQWRVGSEIGKLCLSISLNALFIAERLLRLVESPVETYCERRDDECHTQEPERDAYCYHYPIYANKNVAYHDPGEISECPVFCR